MALFVLDTNVLTDFSHGRPAVVSRVLSRPPEEIAITVITVEEGVSGWQRMIRGARTARDQAQGWFRLAEIIPTLARWQILPFTEAGIDRFESLERLRLNVKGEDLRIAAIVLEHDATLVTRNVRDFERIPGLKYENWAD
ncbi:MAG: type II toxin-antitoxin system VapC family toxin [Gemmataceae bacterium]